MKSNTKHLTIPKVENSKFDQIPRPEGVEINVDNDLSKSIPIEDLSNIRKENSQTMSKEIKNDRGA